MRKAQIQIKSARVHPRDKALPLIGLAGKGLPRTDLPGYIYKDHRELILTDIRY